MSETESFCPQPRENKCVTILTLRKISPSDREKGKERERKRKNEREREIERTIESEIEAEKFDCH